MISTSGVCKGRRFIFQKNMSAVSCVCRESLIFGCDTEEPQTINFLLEYFARLDLKWISSNVFIWRLLIFLKHVFINKACMMSSGMMSHFSILPVKPAPHEAVILHYSWQLPGKAGCCCLCQGAKSSKNWVSFQMAFHSSWEAVPVSAESKIQLGQTELSTNAKAMGINIIPFWLSHLKVWALSFILVLSLSHDRK